MFLRKDFNFMPVGNQFMEKKSTSKIARSKSVVRVFNIVHTSLWSTRVFRTVMMSQLEYHSLCWCDEFKALKKTTNHDVGWR